MKKMDLLFIGGRHSGKTTFMVRALNDAFSNVPEWMNLKFSLHEETVPGALAGNFQALEDRVQPGPMHGPDFSTVCIRARKKKAFWFLIIMEMFRLLLLRRHMTEIGGVMLQMSELSIENPHLGEWLLEHTAKKKVPLGVVLVVDPFAVGKTCESRHSPDVAAVVERLVERFEQIFVGNPEKRLPVSVAVVVNKAESFSQFRTNSLRYVDSATLRASRNALGDADGMLADSFLLNEIIEKQSGEIRELMDQYDGNFVNILQNEFRSVRYFWSGDHEERGKTNFCRMTSPLLPLLWLLGEQMEF
ncbi:MAG: hypothetical protein IJD43_06295 [Thermoguttaceae bacterium]|nr:hypothetical protein [Planctomycetaceae bacterium]MBQ4143068.1 hypothetical protein [Thermoguttaceae bacterium]